MATEEELELLREQRDLTQEMIRLLRTQTESMNALQAAYAGQVNVTQQATSAIEEHSAATAKTADETERYADGLSKAAKKSESLTQKMQGWLNKSTIPGVQGLSDAVGQLGNNFSMVADVISNPLQAALGFMSTFFDAIMEMAVERTKEFIKFREALEQVRKEFGSFNENTSNRIKKTYDTFGRSLKDAAGGANVFASKFNMGVDGAIERLQMVAGIATDLGPVFDALGSDFDDAAAQLYVMKEALGFSGEALKKVGTMAIVSSKSLKQFTNEILANTNKIATGLGLSSKVLGKDVSAYISNFKNLGKMTGDYTKEIIKAAAYTRKLGIELAELTGLTDKFDDFESGAEAAAQLAAGFGMVLDPVKLMQAQNPAEVLNDMQKAFAATGRSFESLTRQDKALLTSMTGLNEEQAALAFSSQGLSMSYDQIKTQAEGAAKKQKTQEEVIRDLADSIENVIYPMKEFTGFLSAFIAGFQRAFETSGPLQKTVSELAKALMRTYEAGIRTFSAFLKIPGVNAVFTGLLEIVKSLGNVFSGIALKVEKFVSMMSKDPKKAASDLMTGITQTITEGFGNLFSDSGKGSIFSNILNGLSQTFLAVIAALPGILIGLVRSTKSILRSLIDTMRDAFKPSSGGPSVGGALIDAIKEGISTLIAELPTLMPLLFEFGTELVSFIGRAIQEFPLASLFVAGGPVLTVAGDIFNQLIDTVTGLFGGSGGEEAMGAAAEQVEKTATVQEQVTASLNRMGAGAEGSEFSGLVARFGGAAEKAADWGALALGISLVGAAIVKLAQSVVEPIPELKGMSLADKMAELGTKFAGVDPKGLESAFMFVGGVVAAAMAGVAGMMLALSQMSGTELAVSAFAAWLAKGIVDDLLNTILPKVGTMIQSVVGYLGGTEFQTSLENIKNLSKQFTEEDTKTMTGLSSVFSTIGSMVAVVLNISNQVSTIPPLVVNDGEFIRLETDGEKLNRIIGYVGIIIGDKAAGTGMMGVIGKIEAQFAGADLNALAAKFTAFASIITPVSNAMVALMKPGLEFAGMIKDFVGAGDTSIPQDMITAVTDFIGAIGSAAIDITMEIHRRINLSQKDVDALMGKTAVIQSMGKMIGDFATSMVNLSKTVEDLATQDINQDAFARMRELLFGETGTEGAIQSTGGGIIPIMQQVIESINGFLGGTSTTIDVEKMKGFESIFRSDGVLMGLINSVSEMSAAGAQKVVDATWFLAAVTGQGGDRNKGIAAHLKAMTDSFAVLDDINVGKLASRETAMKASFNVVGSYVDGMSVVSEGAKARVDASYAQLIGIRDTMKNTADLLDQIDIPMLDAKIDDFNKKLTVTKSRFEVNGGAVVINVNLGVSLSAQKMAETLVLEGMVAANPEFGDYLNSGDAVRKNQYDYFTTEYTAGKNNVDKLTTRKGSLGEGST